MKLVREHINEGIGLAKATPINSYMKEKNPQIYNMFIDSINLITEAQKNHKTLLDKYELFSVKEFIDALNTVCLHTELHGKSYDDILYPFFGSFGSVIRRIMGGGVLSYIVLNNYFPKLIKEFNPEKSDWVSKNEFVNFNYHDNGIIFYIPKTDNHLINLAKQECAEVSKYYNEKVCNVREAEKSDHYTTLGIGNKIIK